MVDSNDNTNSAGMGNAGMGNTDASQNKGSGRPDSIKDALRILDEALASQAANLRELVTNDYQNIRSAISGISSSESFRGIADQVRNFSTSARGRATEFSSVGMDKTKQVYSDIDTQVRANPWPILGGIAAGTFALGFLLGRSGSDTNQIR